MMFSCGQQKMCLIKMLTGCYIFLAATLLAVGCGSPVNTLATLSALSAFFVVAAIFATVRHFMAWCIRIPCVGTQTDAHSRMHHTTMSMVALAGPTSVGPGSSVTGTSTPVRAIASECGSFSDSHYNYTLENCHHAQTPQKPYPRFGHHHYHSSTQLRLSAQAGPCKNTFISFVHRNTGWQSSSSIHSLYFFLHPR
ncbi:ash family protein [Salmonella enterica]|nr:ash family protein [Salmonella enterica]EKS4649283.1 ash family protein [Salmonella enterica]